MHAAHSAGGLWLDSKNHPQAIAAEAFKKLKSAENEGLNPSDYAYVEIETLLSLASAGPLSEAQAIRLDELLTKNVVRYLNDLYYGRIDPKKIHENYSEDARPAFVANTLLAQALRAGDLGPLWIAATPKAPMYSGLRTELARYLNLRNTPAWNSPLPHLGKPILPGQQWPGLNTLTQRLIDVGDLPENAAKEPGRYTPALQQAIATYQTRHRLKKSGRIDRATIDSLNVAPAERAAQIARTLERLRWTPLQQTQRMIVVNVPEYRLRAYTLDNQQVTQVLPINVIVGKASSTKTPLFNKEMLYVEFSPFWNVPLSITRNEMVPRLQRDPDYVKRNNFEILDSNGIPTEVTPEALTGLSNGSMRIRQRPGQGNALGDVKFVFPNKDNIYIHHTSSPSLFNRQSRSLSHGCIRVEDPVALAQYVLQDDPLWTTERIRRMMNKGISNTVRLKKPIPVVIAYLNTIIDEDGSLHFLPDIYGQDKKLEQALSKQ